MQGLQNGGACRAKHDNGQHGANSDQQQKHVAHVKHSSSHASVGGHHVLHVERRDPLGVGARIAIERKQFPQIKSLLVDRRRHGHQRVGAAVTFPLGSQLA